jgi:methylated-DNA-[protein]-cysteine S-methyltransferase
MHSRSSRASTATATLVMDSPVGPLEVVSDGEAITHVLFVDDDVTVLPNALGSSAPADTVLAEAQRQLRAYFDGELAEFDMPLAPVGTQFQRRVWHELEQIPYGETASYGEIAMRLGLPMGASRAVGTANGSNPIAIVVPCHRVIGANGTLTGYAGGLHRKRYLLDLESRASQPQLFPDSPDTTVALETADSATRPRAAETR